MDKKTVNWIYFISATSALICVSVFFFNFMNQSISKSTEQWGQLGDYVGGFMNPIASLLNVYVTIQIARAVNSFSTQQTKQQLEVQKELVKTQLLYEILKDFKRDILTSHNSIDVAENAALNLKQAVANAQNVMDGFIKHHQSLFAFPPGIAISIFAKYQEWLVQLTQGHYDKEGFIEFEADIKLKIDLMISLLYGSLIEDAKIPEKKPVTQEVMDYWESKLAEKA